VNGSMELVGAIEQAPFFRSMARPELAEILSSARAVRHEPGDRVLRAYDDAAAVVLEGNGVITLPTAAGEDLVVDVFGPGRTYGLPVVVGRPSAGLELRALTPVNSLLLAGGTLRRLCSEGHTLLVNCVRTINAELATAREDAARFACSSTTDRVLTRLLQLAEAWGEPCAEGVRVRVPLTQELLASWAHTSRNSTAQVLRDLRMADIVRTGRRELTILDLDRLQRRCRSHRAADEPLPPLLRTVV
jgi:CRP/FNR family transcriptional regulator, cyclic AMP receptor protein